MGTPVTNHKIPPGPRGAFLLGSLPDLQRRGIFDLYVEAWREFGDVVRFKMGPLTQVLFAQPEHVKHILVTNRQNYCKGIGYAKLKSLLGPGLLISEGELWQRQRRLMQPLFTAKSVTRFADEITRLTETFLKRWQVASEQDAVLDISFEMMRLTATLIGQTMFSVDVSEEAGETGEAFSTALKFVTEHTVTLLDVPLFLPTPDNRRFNDAIRRLDTFVYGLIEDRRKRPASREHSDLLTMLLNARDEETGQGMSEKQLRDEVITIFFAGHETTANALTWTWYLLSQHPEVESRLQAELAHVLGGRAPTVEDLPHLNYTRRALEEAMRLYPPVMMFVRDAIGEDHIGGYTVAPGTMLVVSPYLTQRHPDFWEHPEAFDPEHFSAERVEKRHHYAYFPFGGGQRLCIGNHFALLEGHLILAMIAQHYRLRLAPGHPVQPKMMGTLRPAHGMRMLVEQR